MDNNSMIAKQTWETFRSSGLLWWINMLLHTFGWSIVVETEDDTNIITSVYPARVKFRGFREQDNTRGYIKVSKYLNDNAKEIFEESKN